MATRQSHASKSIPKESCDSADSVAPLACTIGHSNRSIEDFIALLYANDIAKVIDVRTIPRSRHNPQFNMDTLPASLATVEIAYAHMPGLGGLRHTCVDSVNKGWRNASFRGYADYMQSAEFANNVAQLVELAQTQRYALMCAEAVPWRCHRSMIADALAIRGVRVEDIIGSKGRKPHILTPFAHVDGLHLPYPPPPLSEHSPIAKRAAVKATAVSAD